MTDEHGTAGIFFQLVDAVCGKIRVATLTTAFFGNGRRFDGRRIVRRCFLIAAEEEKSRAEEKAEGFHFFRHW